MGIEWEHRNTFQGSGRALLIASIEEFSRKALGRYLARRARLLGLRLQLEGVAVSMTRCSLFVQSNRIIAEWSDHE